MQIYVAEFETLSTSSHAYGKTAIEAVKSLVEMWKNDWTEHSGASPSYINKYREELNVYQVEIGKAYVLGSTDKFSRPIVATGEDVEFDGIFGDLEKDNSMAMR